MNRMLRGAVCKDSEMKHFMAHCVSVVLSQQAPKYVLKNVYASVLSIFETILCLPVLL